jgi:lipopolysaccharide/colanic/teichoic acid biosynthesis glycosyltransferase
MPDSLQRVLALIGAIATAPIVAMAGLLLWRESGGPLLYRAVRVGDGGRSFTCFKLRTMRTDAGGPGVTTSTDARVGSVARWVRRARIDELPQLWNVVRGDMRLVGPRPEDPRFVDLDDPLHREVFSARPGMTGLTQLLFSDEGASLDPQQPERHYRDAVLPAKLRLDAAYLRHRSVGLDLWILAQTPRALLGRPVVLPEHLRAALGG